MQSAVQFLFHPTDARALCQQTDRANRAEAEELAADGVKELILVAQDSSFYGIDIYGEAKLAELTAGTG